MRVSLHQLRRATSAAAVTLAVTLALPTAAFADEPRLSACDDLLVTISPTSSDGDVRAAAVTAQVLVADVPGWESVTWAVADSTDLREVLVLHSDGATRSVGAARNGTAADVLAVGFCGTTGDNASDVEVAAEPDTSTTSIDPEPAPAPEPKPEPKPEPEAEPEPAADAGAEEASDVDEAQHLDDVAVEDDSDEAAVFAGPVGPTTAPYHDAARAGQVTTTTAVSATVDATSGLTLLAASSAGATGGMASAVSSDAGHGTALVALFVGAAAALLLLATRRRFDAAVRA